MGPHSLLKQADCRRLAKCRDKGGSFTGLNASAEQGPGA